MGWEGSIAEASIRPAWAGLGQLPETTTQRARTDVARQEQHRNVGLAPQLLHVHLQKRNTMSSFIERPSSRHRADAAAAAPAQCAS